MTRQGTVSGNTIELDEPLPLPNGERITVSVLPSIRPDPAQPFASSDPQTVLTALRDVPKVSDEDVEELLRVIDEEMRATNRQRVDEE